MQDRRVGSRRRVVVVAALAMGCGKAIGGGPEAVEGDPAVTDAGTDGASACPDDEPDGTGVVQLRRGCPLTIDYAIR